MRCCMESTSFMYFRPPYMASNMVDLLKNINNKPLSYPSDVKVNPVLIDVLKKMLIPDVKKRISWSDLFIHPINRYLDHIVRK
jgi:serine/threonine protein kinase